MTTDAFINMVCHFLKITRPNVSHETNVFESDTMLTCTDGDTVYIRETDTPDFYFALAHELRHVWQIRNGKLDSYKTRGNTSLADYNSQPAEVDANAFALLATQELLNLTPRFDNFTDAQRAKIYKRAFEIADEI